MLLQKCQMLNLLPKHLPKFRKKRKGKHLKNRMRMKMNRKRNRRMNLLPLRKLQWNPHLIQRLNQRKNNWYQRMRQIVETNLKR